MQILMGPHHTLVHIDNTKTAAYHLFHFIKTHFSSYHYNDNSLHLNYTYENHHKHLFLLKWLYSLHKKNTATVYSDFKNVLVNRIEKPIKIILKKPIDKQVPLGITIYPDRRISFKLIYPIPRLLDQLAKSFSMLFTFRIEDERITVYLESDADKRLLREFLTLSKIGDYEIVFQYNKAHMEQILQPGTKVHAQNDLLRDAFHSLNSHPDETLDVIRKRYKKLLTYYHPDKVFIEGMDKVEEHTRIFKNLQDSFEIIQNSYYSS